MKVFTYFLLCFFVCHLASSVQVIDFNTDYIPPNAQAFSEAGDKDSISTRELTICFRFMPRYNYGYTLIKTKQLLLHLRENEGFFNLNPLNPASSNEVYSRMVPFCDSCVSGKWISMCLGMKLTNQTQYLKVYQKGKLCWNKTYSDGEFGAVYYKKSSSLTNM